MEALVVSTGWLVFTSIFNYILPTWNKDNNMIIHKGLSLSGKVNAIEKEMNC